MGPASYCGARRAARPRHPLLGAGPSPGSRHRGGCTHGLSGPGCRALVSSDVQWSDRFLSRQPHDWTVMCIDSGVAELTRLARTIPTWREEFLAYFTTSRASNGPTEAVNLLIKRILRVGHGFRNFDNG